MVVAFKYLNSPLILPTYLKATAVAHKDKNPQKDKLYVWDWQIPQPCPICLRKHRHSRAPASMHICTCARTHKHVYMHREGHVCTHGRCYARVNAREHTKPRILVPEQSPCNLGGKCSLKYASRIRVSRSIFFLNSSCFL